MPLVMNKNIEFGEEHTEKDVKEILEIFCL